MSTAAPAPMPDLQSRRICDLQLSINTSPLLRPAVVTFRGELAQRGITLQPHLFLADQWGVMTGTVSIGIPFYLADQELIAYHQRRVGHLEGATVPDLLRYLRHEMGHVVLYAYRLYRDRRWRRLFGSYTRPYVEDYVPEPFCRRYVRHLPGWYAQMHAEEDWAETFAVWMTPNSDWRVAYAESPRVLAKLEYCDRVMNACASRKPLVSETVADDTLDDMEATVEKHYDELVGQTEVEALPELEAALRSIFEEDVGTADGSPPLPGAADLIDRLEPDLVASGFRWTGHFPAPIRALVCHLAKCARELNLVYAKDREAAVSADFTALVTSLAMNHVLQGEYLPQIGRVRRAERAASWWRAVSIVLALLLGIAGWWIFMRG